MRYLIKGKQKVDGSWHNVSATFNDEKLDDAIKRFKERFSRPTLPGDRVKVEAAYIQVMGEGWRVE